MSTKKKAPSGSAKSRTSAKPSRNSKVVTSAKARTGSKPPASIKPDTDSKRGTRAVAKTGTSAKSGKVEAAIRKNVKDISATLESMAPPGSPERVAVGVAAVAGGALIAGATLGAGPAALAGAAGYLAYKGLSGPEKKKARADSGNRKHKK